jgi:Domain of unknown function (DUF4185)
MYIAAENVRRISQLTGQWDRSYPGGTVDRGQAAHIVGTDLGSTFFDGDRLWFLFGDTWPDPALGDSIAYTYDTDPAAGLQLTFLDASGHWVPPFVDRPGGFPMQEYCVPTGGFFAAGRRYVVYTSDVYYDADKRAVMGSSALCYPHLDGTDLADLHFCAEISREKSGGKFINVAPVVVPAAPSGLPFGGPAVLLWGTGRYRRSDAYLAAVPADRDSIEHPKTSWWFWHGTRPDGSQDWVRDQTTAERLFDPPPGHDEGGIGEISAIWLGPLRRWLLAYTSEYVFGAQFRTAAHPWGPWSAAQLLHDPNSPTTGFGKVMHLSWDDGGMDGTDLLYDPGRGPEGGAPYAPYLIDRFTKQVGARSAQVYFALSTWNPYQAHLMTATLTERPGSSVIDVDRPPLVRRFAHRELVVGPDIDERPHLPPLPSGGITILQSRFGPKANNFELAVPALTGGILFVAARNDPWPPAWGPSSFAGKGRDQFASFDAVAMLLSNVTRDHEQDRLVLAAVTGGRAVYLLREPTDPWNWSGPYPVIAVEPDDRRYPLVGVRGNPALVASTFGSRKTNWELIVADATTGIRHFWYDNDPQFPVHGDWRLAPTFANALGRVDAVALIQSVFGNAERGNLEVLARCGTSLHVLWRDESMTWQGPFPLVVDGAPITVADGTPALLQSKYGAGGRDFHAVTPLAAGGLAPYWRDNSPPNPADWHWHASPVLDPGTHYVAAALVAGPFGPAPGNLELVATTTAGQVRHFYREVGDPGWRDAGLIPLP